MSYEKRTWVTGEIITADKLNHMEAGIESAQFKIITGVEGDNNPATGSPLRLFALELGDWSEVSSRVFLADEQVPDNNFPFIINDTEYNSYAFLSNYYAEEKEGSTPDAASVDNGYYINKNTRVFIDYSTDTTIVFKNDVTKVISGGSPT